MTFAIKDRETGMYLQRKETDGYKHGLTKKLSEAICFGWKAWANDFIGRRYRPEQFEVIALCDIVGPCCEIGGRLHVMHPDDAIMCRDLDLAEYVKECDARMHKLLAQGKDPNVFQWVPYVDDKSDQKQQQKEESIDSLYYEAVRSVRATGYVSASAIQRTFEIGYIRATRLIEDMERNGVVSRPDAITGKREINYEAI